MKMEAEARNKKEIERDHQKLEQEEEEEEDEGIILKDIPDGSKRIQPWTKQITVRGILASITIGIVFSVIAMKLNLTTGLTPHFNVSAALLAFVFIRLWTKVLHKAGYVARPFTRQENTMIQTCAVACYSISVGGLIYLIFRFL